jgi:hypothetical protein
MPHGKRDGKIVIENASPKVTGGAREVISCPFVLLFHSSFFSLLFQ